MICTSLKYAVYFISFGFNFQYFFEDIKKNKNYNEMKYVCHFIHINLRTPFDEPFLFWYAKHTEQSRHNVCVNTNRENTENNFVIQFKTFTVQLSNTKRKKKNY